jgi:hypothetical protein
MKSVFTAASLTSFTPSTVALLRLTIFGPYTTIVCTTTRGGTSQALSTLKLSKPSCAPAGRLVMLLLSDVAFGCFSLAQTTERYFDEFAKKDGYNSYFQDHFASSTRSELCPH